jgi:competence protein ComEA
MVFQNLDRTSRLALLVAIGIALGASAWLGYRHMMAPRLLGGKTFPIHVSGAVKDEKVCQVTSEMLVWHAVEAAGGPTPDADLSQLNLAAPLLPNTQVYVPRKGEVVSPERLGPYAASQGFVSSPKSSNNTSPPSSEESQKSEDKNPPAGKINVNTATLKELESLPRIGPVLAQRIIDYRNSVGKFQSVDDLLNVRGIGKKTLELIRPYVTAQ